MLEVISQDHTCRIIHFNSKTLLKDGSKLIFPGAIQTCDQYNNFHTYIQNNTGSSDNQANTTYTFIQKHIHKHSYNVYTNIYIHHSIIYA